MNIKEIVQPYYDKLASMERLKNNVDSNNNKVVELDESVEVLNSKLDILNKVEISLNKEKAVSADQPSEVLITFASELNDIKKEKVKKIEDYRIEILDELGEKHRELEMLNLRLERLMDNKEAELKSFFDEYDPKLFANYNYAGTVRKDLEDAYLKSEEEIKQEIKEKEENLIKLKQTKERDYEEFIKARELEFQITIEEKKFEIEGIISNKNQEKTNLNSDSASILENLEKYSRVDVRELVEIKKEARRKLIAYKNELELELRECQINADMAFLGLSKFKAIYDENRVMTNSAEYKTLFEKSGNLLEKCNEIRVKIKEVEKQIKAFELTKEEGDIILITMNQLEQDEYDRRKGIEREEASFEFEYNNMEAKEEVIEEQNDSFIYSEVEAKEQEEVNEAVSEFEYNNMDVIEDVETNLEFDKIEVPEKDPTNVEFDKIEESTPITEEKETLDSANELIATIYKDIVSSVKEVNTLEIDGSLPLPNGKYINTDDMIEATNNYFAKMKGRTLKVEASNKEFVIDKAAVKKLRSALKHSATSILLSEEKIGEADLKRVYGVSGLETYNLGRKRTDLPSGYYSHVDLYLKQLKEVFVEKQETWLDKFVANIKNKKAQKTVTSSDFVEEQESVKTR